MPFKVSTSFLGHMSIYIKHNKYLPLQEHPMTPFDLKSPTSLRLTYKLASPCLPPRGQRRVGFHPPWPLLSLQHPVFPLPWGCSYAHTAANAWNGKSPGRDRITNQTNAVGNRVLGSVGGIQDTPSFPHNQITCKKCRQQDRRQAWPFF